MSDVPLSEAAFDPLLDIETRDFAVLDILLEEDLSDMGPMVGSTSLAEGHEVLEEDGGGENGAVEAGAGDQGAVEVESQEDVNEEDVPEEDQPQEEPRELFYVILDEMYDIVQAMFGVAQPEQPAVENRGTTRPREEGSEAGRPAQRQRTEQGVAAPVEQGDGETGQEGTGQQQQGEIDVVEGAPTAGGGTGAAGVGPDAAPEGQGEGGQPAVARRRRRARRANQEQENPVRPPWADPFDEEEVGESVNGVPAVLTRFPHPALRRGHALGEVTITAQLE